MTKPAPSLCPLGPNNLSVKWKEQIQTVRDWHQTVEIKMFCSNGTVIDSDSLVPDVQNRLLHTSRSTAESIHYTTASMFGNYFIIIFYFMACKGISDEKSCQLASVF